jgi:hypothetical protein
VDGSHHIVAELGVTSRLLPSFDAVEEIAPVLFKGSAASSLDFFARDVTNDFALRVDDCARTFKTSVALLPRMSIGTPQLLPKQAIKWIDGPSGYSTTIWKIQALPNEPYALASKAHLKQSPAWKLQVHRSNQRGQNVGEPIGC